ncbi:MAG: SMC-Scp complex subunit ScpB [Planctomycetota bacterium]
MAKSDKKSNSHPPPAPASIPAPAFASELEAEPLAVDDGGLSLEELSEAYAALMGGADPYQAAPAPADAVDYRDSETAHDSLDGYPSAAPNSDGAINATDESGLEDDDESELAVGRESQRKAADEVAFEESTTPAPPCEISPRTILEAMLFVGHPAGQPLTAKLVSSLMRGVRPREIDDLIQELNETYDAEETPYRVESVADGYQLVLRSELHGLRDVFYGRVKEAKLSQAAIDVLAVVAYNQPLTRPEIDHLRHAASASLLSQLVRRGLLRVERPDQKPREPIYYTTERFLELFHLSSLDELPRSPDPDRGLLS